MFPPLDLPVAFFVPGLLILIAGIYALLGLLGWRHRESLVARVFTWLMLALGIWSLGYGLEIYSQPLLLKILWARMEYLGITSGPVLWLLFALAYTGQWQWLTKPKWVGLWLIPTTTLILFWTNEFHHLVWNSVTLIRSGELTLLAPQYGWFFWPFMVFSYACLLAGSMIAVVGAWRSPPLYRAQALTTIIAVILPLAGNVIYVFAGGDLDLTPFFFLPSSIALSWAIARYRLLDIIPPTQNAILQNLRDGVLVLDARRRVLYMNRAAAEFLSQNANRSLGQPAEIICGIYGPRIMPLLGKVEQSIGITLDDKEETRNFEVRISPNYLTEKDRRSEKPAWLIIFHDVTEQKQAESALLRREAILRAVSLASEQFLKSASWEKNIQRVLDKMGRAADASRVYIFESHSSEDGISLLSQRYEWVADGIQPQIDNPDLQNLSWREAGFARWADELEQQKTISGPVREFPVMEQELLKQQEILSVAIIPIFLEDTLWGFIGFDDCLRERQWSEAELDALRAAADIFGAALARRNIELRLIKGQHSQELLQEIIRAALGKRTIEEMAQFLVYHLGSLIGADHCFLSGWNEIREQTIPIAAYGVPLEQYLGMVVLPGEKSLSASALEAGHMLVVDDAQNSQYVSLRIAELFHTRSVLVIPMISNEKKLGAVMLGFSNLHRFTPEEIILSEQAAELVTLSFAKIQAVDEAHRRADESETLRRAGATVAETLNLQDATTRLLEQLAYVVPHDSASVQLLRDGELEIIGGEGWTDPSSVIGVRFPIPGDNPNTKVIETRQPLLLNDTYEAYPAFRTIQHASHIRSWMGVPLIVHNQIIGLLAIDSREANHFTEDDVQLATTFAGQVAVAIENARLFDETQELAITDGLTGLYNHRHFMELAQNEFERARRYKRQLSVMIFDIDHFKNVNDAHGHLIGDQVLHALAALCKEKWREADPIGRYGGDEFIALIVEADAKIGRVVAERLRREVEKMAVPIQNSEIKITISIGISELDENTPTLETLIARADQALYSAKHKGRNRVAIGH
ncbi:MAG: diguanylate cyclase [Anaerolineaceae bacterium]|nr:MAG: diguanylate cyclase [Anaerolineaceae bacterium]